MPATLNPLTHRLVVWVEGDHSVRAIRINGQPMNVPANRTKLISITFEGVLSHGPQQIDIDIQEVKTHKAFRSGLRVKLELQRTTTPQSDNP